MATELALYQIGEPVLQVAVNEAVAPLHIIGLFVPVGKDGLEFIVTLVVAVTPLHPPLEAIV